MQPSFGFLSSILALSVLVAAMPAPADTSSQNCRTQHEACLSKGLTQAQCNAHLSQCQHDASGNLLEKRRGRGRGGRGRGGGGKKSKTSKTKTKTKSKTQQGTPTSSIDLPGTIETVASVASIIVNTFPTPTPDFNNSGGSDNGDGESDTDGGDSDPPPPPSPTGATTVTASEPEGTTTAQNGGDDVGSESTDTPSTDGDAEPTATGAGSQGPPTGIPISLQAVNKPQSKGKHN